LRAEAVAAAVDEKVEVLVVHGPRSQKCWGVHLYLRSAPMIRPYLQAVYS